MEIHAIIDMMILSLQPKRYIFTKVGLGNNEAKIMQVNLGDGW